MINSESIKKGWQFEHILVSSPSSAAWIIKRNVSFSMILVAQQVEPTFLLNVGLFFHTMNHKLNFN